MSENRDEQHAMARHGRTIAAVAAAVVLLIGVVVVRSSGSDGSESTGDAVGAVDESAVMAGGGGAIGDERSPGAAEDDDFDGTSRVEVDETASGAAPGGVPSSTSDADRAVGGVDVQAESGAGTAVPGVTDEEITVVYYWKGDRTRTSPFLAGSGAESNVDEAEAFRGFIDYLNANDGTGTFMGHPIDLHGRKLNGVVVEAGQSPEDYPAAAAQITEEIKPFAAVAAHGSISTYLCPAMAAAGIHNLATYDLSGALEEASDGYCLPAGLRWEDQVGFTEAYLLDLHKQNPDLVVGVVYAEYPGLVDATDAFVARYRAAGINVGAVASMSTSLTTAQQQAPNVVTRMRAAGVNLIVMPDAGAPLSITHAAEAQAYFPDYYVWPCSGQDTMGMVRLLNTSQWNGATGLTCYDAEFTSDLTMTAKMRATEWYEQYTATTGEEPPAPSPFVYAAMLPLVVGIGGAGDNLTLESFRAALDAHEPVRYDAIEGRTRDAANMLIDLSARRVIADVTKIEFDANAREPGAPLPGTYLFPEDRRYATPSELLG